jgi:hypothetical protein
MGLDLNTALISDTFDGLIKTTDANALTGSPLVLTDGRGNNSSIAIATAGNGVTITGTLLVDGANISTGLSTAQADIIAIEAKTDFITVTGAVNLDTIKTKANFITVTQAVNLDTIESDILSAKTKTDFITVTQAVNLDTMESDILSAKTKTDFITIGQPVNLDNLESDVATAQGDITAIETKTDFITISSPLNLNTVASNASAAKTKTDFITITQAVNLDTLESDVNVAQGDITAIEAKTDFITIASALNLNTVASNASDAKTKTDFITITQAVNLDTVESGLSQAQTDINIIEGKTDFITITQAVDLDQVEADTATALSNANSAKAKTDFITITQAVNLDTVESDLDQAKTDINIIEGKTDFITVTQAVNLDTMESDITTNNAKNSYPSGDATKVGFISVTQAVDLNSLKTDVTNLSANKYDKTGGAISGSVTIGGDLTVNGTTTTINTQTLSVEDPLIELANQNSANTVDTGFFANYSLDAGVTTKYSGLFKDASDADKFKLFKGLEVEPTTTVDTAGTGYAKGDLVVNDLDAVTISGALTGNVSGNVTGNLTGNVDGNVTGDLTGTVTGTSVLADGVIATTQATSDNSTKVATTAFVKSVVTAEDLDIAGDSGTGAVDLDSQTLTIAGTANEIETSASGQTITIGLPSSVTVGTLTATNLGGTLSTAAQPNVTSVGTLSSLTVAGALNGTLSTAAQPNVTSVGTLSSLAVSGNLTVDTDTLFVDAANNNVGIGTSSIGANSALLVNKNNGYLSVNSNVGAGGSSNPSYDNGLHFGFNRSNGSAEANIIYGSPSGLSGHLEIGSWNGSTYAEAMRIDSSRTVSIGTTARDPITSASIGFSFDGTDKLLRGYQANLPLIALSRGNDGQAIIFNRDATAVGSINVATSGVSIYLGGTAAANELDDYEEGTFTPTLVYSTSGTPTYSIQLGRYTKIGRMVQVQTQIAFNENGAVGDISFQGLPFTSVNSNARAIPSILSLGLTGLPTNVSITGLFASNSTIINLFLNDNALTALSSTYTDNDQDFFITITYEAA